MEQESRKKREEAERVSSTASKAQEQDSPREERVWGTASAWAAEQEESVPPSPTNRRARMAKSVRFSQVPTAPHPVPNTR
jgi:hypothetical protein